MSYEQYRAQFKGKVIDEIGLIACPKCGTEMDPADNEMEEEYDDYSTFSRTEHVYCYDCGIRVEVRQVYFAGPMTVTIEED